MKIDDKKFHNYSLAFHQKETQLSEVSSRVKMGFHNFQRHQKILKPRTIEVFLKFSDGNKKSQKQLLEDDSEVHIEAIFDIIKSLNSDRDLMEFVLPTLDAILTEERIVLREVVDQLRANRQSSVLSNLKSLLNVEDHREATYESAARIVSILYGELPREGFYVEQKAFMLELLSLRRREGRRARVSEFCLMSCLVHLNKHQDMAEIFLEHSGSEVIMDALRNNTNEVQLLYYTLLNIWLLSFVPSGIEDFISDSKFGVIRHICDILQKISREKLIRVSFSIFKNIKDSHSCLELMMDNKLLKIIDTLLKGSIKEEDLVNSIKEVGEVLEMNIKVLSSFEKYSREVAARHLEWSAVHTQRFWKENAGKFQANDYLMVTKLAELLKEENHQNQAIACYDLGEFCRFYPRGRMVLESLHVKDLIMEKARYSSEKAVREQALLALQKLMIQNWQSI